MALTAKIQTKLVATLTNALDLTTVEAPIEYDKVVRLTSGTGLNQADKIWHDQRTLSASASENIDLAGTLTDPFGATFTLAKLKGLLVVAASGNTNNVNVSREATNGVPVFLAASDGIPVRPGGMLLWVAPDATAVTVTAGTGDLLVVANSGAGSSVTYDIVVIGTSA